MRVLLTHPHCWPYVRRGTERNIDNVARSLATRGHDVTLLSTLPGGSEPPAPGPVHQALHATYWRPLMGLMRLQPEHLFGVSAYRHLRPLGADVVHSFFYADSLAASLVRKKKGWRTVLQLNGIAIPGMSCRRIPPEAWLLKKAIDEADEFVVCSSFIGSLAAQYYGRQPRVIVPPIELDAWPFSAVMPQGPPRVLAVGDFDVPRKGVRVLLKAFELFLRREPEAILQISGKLSPEISLPLLAALPERARGRVHILGLGKPGDLPLLYQQASFLVLPAMWEPSGTVMFEAWASGTPVVTANHAGLPEFVTGDVGVLFDPESQEQETHNAEGLAEAMQSGLQLSRIPGTREKCRKHAARFSSAAIVPVLEEIYAGR